MRFKPNSIPFRTSVALAMALAGLGCSGTESPQTTSNSAATGGSTSPNGTSSTGGATTANSAIGGSGGATNSTCVPSNTQFSFFVTSRARLFALAQAFNASANGFGGDLRYGETGNGAGLLGADKICTAIAETSMPGNCKQWHAFLSTSAISAISRIGAGPWYDRLGRLVANNTTELLNTRPVNANTTIINDLPNEDGTPHHQEETNSQGQAADNHDILTGTNAQGNLYGASSTCSDWTSISSSIKPRCGHSWPTSMGGGNPGGGSSGCDMSNWMCALDESGCAPGYNIIENGPGTNNGTVGSGGGYGAIYCFATTQ